MADDPEVGERWTHWRLEADRLANLRDQDADRIATVERERDEAMRLRDKYKMALEMANATVVRRTAQRDESKQENATLRECQTRNVAELHRADELIGELQELLGECEEHIGAAGQYGSSREEMLVKLRARIRAGQSDGTGEGGR